MHAADDIEPGFQRLNQRIQPFRMNDATDIGNADDQRAGTAGPGLCGRKTRQAGCDQRLRQRELANAESGCPVPQAKSGFSRNRLRAIAQEQQVGPRQFPR